jgi:O-antigen/teichoic acid export membrane protein
MNNSVVKQFLKGTLYTGIGKVAVVAFGIIGLMITTRVMPPEEVGTFVLLLAISLFLKEISSMGLHLAVPRFMASTEDAAEQNRITNTFFYFRIFTIVVTSIIAIAVADALFRLFDSEVANQWLIYVPILVTLESLGKLVEVILQGKFQFRTIGAVNILSSFINFTGILIFVAWLQLGLLGLFYAKILSRVIAYSWAALLTRFRPGREFDWQLLRKLVTFGFPLQINYVMSFVFQRVDLLLVGYLINPAMVAFYDVGRRIPDSLGDTYEAFVQVFFPFVSRFHDQRDEDSASKTLNTSVRWIVFAILTGALIAFLFGSEIILLIFPESYGPSVPVFGIAMVGLAIVMLDSTQGYSLIAAGKSGKIPQINFIRTIIIFIGYFVLIPAFGIVGAAIAGPLAIAMVNPLVVYFLRRSNIQVDVGAYLRAFAWFSVMLAIWLIFQPENILLRLAMIVLFIGGNVLFSVITPWEINQILGFVQRYMQRRLARVRASA